LNKDGYQCEDVNECLDGDLYNCTDEFHKCVNSRGSYKCECEQDLYFIDGKCKGLERNQTAPKPVLPEPRVPSEKEREEAVQFLIPHQSDFEWDFEKDKLFKDTIASVTTDFCAENRTRCALKDARRTRRSPFTELYTTDQVHLLPGYPSNASGSLQVAFYAQQPLGLFIGHVSVLPSSTLADIVITHKSTLESAIGANISDVEVFFKPATPTTSPTVGPDEPSNAWKWAAIGIGVGVVVIILIILIVFWRLKKKATVVKPMPDDDHEEAIIMAPYNRSSRPERRDAWESYTFSQP